MVMIKGLDKFKESFAGLEDQYVLIGGTATYLILTDAGLEPRATKDLDIVLCLEALDAKFGEVFWDFVTEGGYENYQSTKDKPIFYRFTKPRDNTFPFMLELLSRAPDWMEPPEGVHLAPIPVDEDIQSLSAILLDGEYYDFLHEHKTTLHGLSIVDVQGLIPLKAMAWLNLTEQKDKGENISSYNIKKHRSDILRLQQLLIPGDVIPVPDSIRSDMGKFLTELEKATDLNMQNFGFGRETTLEDVTTVLRKAYGFL